ncbi:abnormal spindle-like microcephaly-associated protein homolog [Anabrus simplex]|uniref:abnormal spindle-like microcephaly-associated protein homolog n=1 Tax=Anabrus simplex TaxID=316456 RepID=UPI0035A3572D
MKAAEKAATTIQANFRGYRVRKQLRSTSKKNGPRRRSSSRSTQTPTMQSAPPTATAVDQPVTAERGSGSDQEVNQKEMAVIKIQAGVRGFLVRKRKQTENAAAIKIQAQYRAFRERQKNNKRLPGK